MKAKNKSSIFIGILLIIVSISLCCIFGILCTETALADTDIITTQTLNGTEEVRHNMYIGDSNFNESKDFNTGIKFYSSDKATGTTTNTNTVKMDVNSFYIDFTNAAKLLLPSDAKAYVDMSYGFSIKNSAGQIVFSASYIGSYQVDVNWEYCDYYTETYINNEMVANESGMFEDLLHFSPNRFGKQLVNLNDGDYTIKIERYYQWTNNYVDGFYYCGSDYYDANSEMSGKLQIRKSVPTITITDTSGNQVTSGSSTNQCVEFTAGGEFFSKIYYKTPTSVSYASTTSKSYEIGPTNGWYYAYSQDIFGKTSDTVSIYYDGSPPIGTVYANGTTVASGSYINSTFYYIVTDMGSGLESIYYKSPISGIYAPYSSGSIIPVISPISISTIPLDDGNRFRVWKDMMIAKMLGAYGIILVMNLFFMIIPQVSRMTFFDNSFENGIVHILFLLGGAFAITKANLVISQLCGSQAGGREFAQMIYNFRSGIAFARATRGAVGAVVGRAVGGSDYLKNRKKGNSKGESLKMSVKSTRNQTVKPENKKKSNAKQYGGAVTRLATMPVGVVKDLMQGGVIQAGKNFGPRLRNVATGSTLTNKAEVKPKKPIAEKTAQEKQNMNKAENLANKIINSGSEAENTKLGISSELGTLTLSTDTSSTRATETASTEKLSVTNVGTGAITNTGSTRENEIGKISLKPKGEENENNSEEHKG